MCKTTIVILCALVACAAAKPHVAAAVAPFAYAAPVVAAAPAPFITATSSQVIARNHNGIATAPVFAPYAAAAYTAASPYVARYAAPYSYASSRLIAASPYTAGYSAVAPFNYAAAYGSPFQYAAAAPYVL